MNINTNILKYGLIAFTLLIISCDKQETETNLPKEAILDEGFMSKTEHFDTEMEKSQEILLPLLHRSYDGSLSPEEVEARFQKEIVVQQKEVVQTNKISNRFHFRVMTSTGTGRYDGTNAYVEAKIVFNTDKGLVYRDVILNNPGDDRKRGEYDYYEFVIYMPNVSWVEIISSSLSLQGTDGWNFGYFNAYGYNYYQTPRIEGYGYTGVYNKVFPEYTWLDNTTAWGWDTQYMHGGEGRITF